MEVLAGARGDDHLRSLRGLLTPATTLPTGPADYETAASLHRACRQASGTVRKLIDCLIGAVAIESNAAVLHLDSDFTTLSHHSALRIHPVR